MKDPGQTGAQQAADRIGILREELASPELQEALALTPEQQRRFDEWSRAKLAKLAAEFDVDTTMSQKRVSWGMRIASTLGGIAICAAVILFFVRYWGYLNTPAQVAIAIATPLAALAGAEFAFRRERTLYFTGLLAMVALASFVMNLAVLGSIFNIASTERALAAWGAFAMVLGYRYGLRLMVALGLLLLISYVASAFAAQMGYQWLEFYNWPEHFLLLGGLVFAIPLWVKHARRPAFPAVYRLIGSLTVLISMMSLADWGATSYLPWDQKTIERFYEFAGLLSSAGAIWLGIKRGWNGVVNSGSVFFAIFLFTRLYHWWWDWMPKYVFFAVIGGLGIGLVLAFKQLRGRIVHREIRAAT